MALTLAKVEEIAPDQASLGAARKLLDPRNWPTVAGDQQGLVWGECQGSGALPYRVALSEHDLAYKCSCPSRKLPCKHALALMWMRAEGRPVDTQERPDWVNAWLARRRKLDARDQAEAEEAPPRPRISIAEAAKPAADSGPIDEARAAAQRERNRAERETLILAGLDELDRWIVDQLERGLAGFQAIAAEQCRRVARRLVDAKAGGLANRVEQIPTMMLGVPEALRVGVLIEKLGELHLIAEAYRRQADLPEALRADVRSMVGWNVSREALLANPQAPRVSGRWMVLATMSEVQPDKLRRSEVWLARLDAAEGFAVLIDYAPVSLGAAASPYSPGESFEAELAFYPSPVPLRAVVVEQVSSASKEYRWRAPSHDIAAALFQYEARLADRPWLGRWPMAVHDGVVARERETLFLGHARGGGALPIKARDDDMVLPLVGIGGIDAFGLWDGRCLDLRFAETPQGRWMGV
jgi:hypothetical protein